MITSARYDVARFGSEVVRATPRQSDLIIVSGRVAHKMAEPIRQLYEQMLEPKWVMAMGACSSTAGMFANYADAAGRRQDHPRRRLRARLPAAARGRDRGLITLQKKIQRRHPARLRAAAVECLSVTTDLMRPAGARLAARRAARRHALGDAVTARREIDARAARSDRAPRWCRRRAAEAAGYDFLIDIAATDHLGFGGEVAGYWGDERAAARPQPGGLVGRAASCRAARAQALLGLVPAAGARARRRRAACACACGSTTASRCPPDRPSSPAPTTRSARPST